MKLNRRIFIAYLFIVFSACHEEEPNYFNLAEKSFSKSNYVLAKNQLNMLKSNHKDYEKAKTLIKKIDSIEKNLLLEKIKSDSIFTNKKQLLWTKHAGNYIVNVSDTNSIEFAEIYVLSDDGNAKWMWVYNPYSKKPTVDQTKNGVWSIIDDELIISIENSKETYENFNGVRREKSLTKRFLTEINQEF